MAKYTIKDVARAANVSVGTASMALNGKSTVSEKTRQRIFEVAQQLNYNPNPYARFLNSDKTNLIGLIITEIENPFFGSMIDFIQRELNFRGYDLMLGISRGDTQEEKKIIKKFMTMKVSGIIVVPSYNIISDLSHFDELNRTGIPFCFISSYYPNIEAPCVMSDLQDGAYQLTHYLLKNGHRKIVYLIGNLSSPVSELRLKGYETAYKEFSMSYEKDWIMSTDVTLFGGYHATGQLLKRFQPDAIITINDFMAIGVLKKLKEYQIKVPHDISVAGYDDLIYASMLETPLTTVQQPLEQICRQTVSVFLEQLETGEMKNEKILLKPTLIVRNSSESRY